MNSFGKAFAHVRNCLLMKKMSDVQKLNRGRTKTLTDSTRKRHKKDKKIITDYPESNFIDIFLKLY